MRTGAQESSAQKRGSHVPVCCRAYLYLASTIIVQTAASPKSMNRLPRNQGQLGCGIKVSCVRIWFHHSHPYGLSNRRQRLWDVFRGVFCTHLEVPSHDSSSSNLPMQLSPAPRWAFGNETPHATVLSSREGRLTSSLLKGGHLHHSINTSRIRQEITQLFPAMTGNISRSQRRSRTSGPAVRYKSAHRTLARLEHCNLLVSLAQVGRAVGSSWLTI